jgi:phage baseplate assembly protein W
VADVPHLAFPLRLAEDGGFAVVEQDTLEDVRQCVHVVLVTPRGSRPLAPNVGIEDPAFMAGVDAAELQAALEGDDGEPRARVTIEADPVSAGGEQSVSVRVDLADEPPADTEPA